MIPPVLVPPSDPEFVLILNRRLAEISAALEANATKTTTDTTTTAATVSSSGGTRKQRLAYPAGKQDTGATWWETDTGLLYVVNTASGEAHKWKYAAGEQRGVLTAKPTGLDATDTGLLYFATDYARRFRWTGAAWENAPGEMVQGAIIFSRVNPGTGWVLANGVTTTTSTATGGTASLTTPNLVGAYLKGASSYSGTVVAATAPGLTGSTAAESGHTHSVTVGGINTNASVNTDFFANVTSGTQPFKNNAHTHPIPTQIVTSAAGSSHSHGPGTLAADATGEPAHVDALVYIRL